MQSNGITPCFPEVTAKHLVDYLFEIGPTIQGGAIPPSEISAWASLSGIELTPWEVKELRMLSSVYARQLSESSQPDCPAPYLDEKGIERNRDNVSKQLRNTMRAYFLAKGN